MKTREDLIIGIENLIQFCDESAEKERKNSYKFRSEDFSFGLHTGYISCYELLSEFLRDLLSEE